MIAAAEKRNIYSLNYFIKILNFSKNAGISKHISLVWKYFVFKNNFNYNDHVLMI